ncbi:MAG: MarR family transcriptional regulator [Clostridia bacterium]|nr:MarR family transcriptional regulator [Clostridia bacterium]
MDRFSKFTILVNRIVRNIHRIKSDETSKLGLKGPHVSCLYYLYRAQKPLTARELCDVCDEDKAAISRAVDYLGKEGYVSCDGSAQKRYKSPISLTPKGEEAGIFLAERVDCILAEASAGLTDEKRGVFYECLDLISANLQNICDGTVEKNGG